MRTPRVRVPRYSTLVVGIALAAVGVLGLLDAEGTLDLSGATLLAVLLVGLGTAAALRAARIDRRVGSAP